MPQPEEHLWRAHASRGTFEGSTNCDGPVLEPRLSLDQLPMRKLVCDLVASHIDASG
jgi:hypothetical protein